MALALATVVILALTGCDGAGPKAGPYVLPVTLIMGTPEPGPDAPYSEDLERFAGLVQKRSGGLIRVRIVPADAGNDADALERRMTSGDINLALIPTRTLAADGASRFRVLELPFLITTSEDGAKVARSDLAAQLLEDVGEGRIGLGMVFESVRRPASYGAPFVRAEDFEGARIRVASSPVAAETLRALGAEPVSGVGAGDPDRPLAGAESAFARHRALPRDAVVTANVALSATFNAIIVAQSTWDRLDAGQRKAITEAAREVAAEPAHSEADDAGAFCRSGRTTALASPADLRRLEERTRGVAEEFAETPTGADDLRELRRIIGDGGSPDLVLPAACGAPPGTSAP